MARKRKVRVEKSGSLFWLIFWLIVFFPIGILYLLLVYRRRKTYEYK